MLQYDHEGWSSESGCSAWQNHGILNGYIFGMLFECLHRILGFGVSILWYSVFVDVYIWLLVKTLVPSEHQNSW